MTWPAAFITIILLQWSARIKVSPARLDESSASRLAPQVALGLFDHPYTDEVHEAAAMRGRGYLAGANRSERSLVLLKK